MKRVPFSCRLPLDCSDALTHTAEQLGWSKTEVIIEAVRLFGSRDEIGKIAALRRKLRVRKPA